MEAAYHHILETVGLYPGPVADLVGRDILRIAGHVVGGVGVRPLGADGSHQLVVLVGDEILCRHLRHGVYPVVGLPALLRVRQLAIDLVAPLYLVEQRLFRLGVCGAELPGALKHQMLQIVRQSRRLGWVVFRARAHGDISLYARLLRVDAQKHFQAVVQCVDTGLHHISGHDGVRVILGRGTHPESHGRNSQNQFKFHYFSAVIIIQLLCSPKTKLLIFSLCQTPFPQFFAACRTNLVSMPPKRHPSCVKNAHANCKLWNKKRPQENLQARKSDAV